MKKSIFDSISEIIDNIKILIDSRLELLSLTAFERLVKILSFIISIIVIILIGFFCMFFITLALALWLGNIFNNQILGYLIVAVFYILILLFFLVFRKRLIDNLIIRKVFSILYPKDKNS